MPTADEDQFLMNMLFTLCLYDGKEADPASWTYKTARIQIYILSVISEGSIRKRAAISRVIHVKFTRCDSCRAFFDGTH